MAEPFRDPSNLERDEMLVPPYILTPAQLHRWRLSQALARLVFEDNEAAVWAATRSIYKSPIPTDADPGDGEDAHPV